jgi:hypothetical protein
MELFVATSKRECTSAEALVINGIAGYEYRVVCVLTVCNEYSMNTCNECFSSYAQFHLYGGCVALSNPGCSGCSDSS